MESNSQWLAGVAGPQWREVEAFAEWHGMTVYRAVIHLIHKGLIHEEQNLYHCGKGNYPCTGGPDQEHSCGMV